MTNEMIDKYLDQQGIDPEPKTVYEARYRTGSGIINHYEMNNSMEGKLFANSRKSLRDWIMVAWESVTDKNAFEIENIYKLATENIEASLGKPWAQVRAELEGMK